MTKQSTIANRKKFIAVADSLAIKISTMQPGDKLPTASEIGEQFSITIATASRVLKELKNRGLIQSKPGLGSIVASIKTNKLILWVGDSETQHARKLLNDLNKFCTKDYSHFKILCIPESNLQDEIVALKAKSQLIGGILFFRDVKDYLDNIDFIEKLSIPALFLGSSSYKSQLNNKSAIFYDENEIVTSAMNKLFLLNHKRIGCIYTDSIKLGITRYKLYKKSMQNMGLNEDYFTLKTEGDYIEWFDILMNSTDKRRELRNYFSNLTALIIFHDQQATVIMQYIKELGFAIPEDISVISVDNLDICELLRPKLSSVNIDLYEGAKIALDFFNNPTLYQKTENFNVKINLIERDSICKCH